MKPIVPLTPSFAVTGALDPADYAELARLGFKSIISNLPDGELRHLPASAEAARLAAEAGLAYRHIPVTKSEVFSDTVVGGTVAAASDLPGPILAHCASGMRSAAAWGAAAGRFQPADAIVATLTGAGFNMAALADEFAAQRQPDAGSPPEPLRA
jgi:sulfide:quinone oxidoreductase